MGPGGNPAPHRRDAMTFDQLIARWDSARLVSMDSLSPGAVVIFRPRGEARTVESVTVDGEYVTVKWTGQNMTERFYSSRVVRVAA